MITLTDTLTERIDQLIQAGEYSYNKRYSKYDYLCIERVPGKKYIKLVCAYYNRETKERNHSSVWCFIDKNTGDVYKPASYKAPAKIVRYKLMDDKSYEAALHNADWAGGWLYIR